MVTSLSTIVAVSAVFIVLCTVAVALRFQARRVSRLTTQADDYVICAALLVYASSFVAQLALTLVRISILLFYRRVCVGKGFRNAANVVITLIIGWYISFFFANLFSAWPIRGHWDDTVYDRILIYDYMLIATAALAMILDFTILCMPVYSVLKLQMTRKRNVMVIGIFWLGLFCVASSVMRFLYIVSYTSSKDNWTALFATYLSTAQLNDITIWTIVESCMSVITACLPTYGPFLRSRHRQRQPGSHSFPKAISAPSRWLLSSFSNSSSSQSNKAQYPSQESQVHITPKIYNRPRELSSATSEAHVSAMTTELADLEAQRDDPRGIKVDGTFATHA